MIALSCRPGSLNQGATPRLPEERTFFKRATAPCFKPFGDHRVRVHKCTDSAINCGEVGNWEAQCIGCVTATVS
jgi:hypothetical protein